MLQNGEKRSDEQEVFNHLHLSFCNVVECSFKLTLSLDRLVNISAPYKKLDITQTDTTWPRRPY